MCVVSCVLLAFEYKEVIKMFHEMSIQFQLVINMIHAAFKSKDGVSEGNYHDIVDSMRICSPDYRRLDDAKVEYMCKVFDTRCGGYYNPFEHYENIRFGLFFSGIECKAVQDLVDKFILVLV